MISLLRISATPDFRNIFERRSMATLKRLN